MVRGEMHFLAEAHYPQDGRDGALAAGQHRSGHQHLHMRPQRRREVFTKQRQDFDILAMQGKPRLESSGENHLTSLPCITFTLPMAKV